MMDHIILYIMIQHMKDKHLYFTFQGTFPLITVTILTKLAKLITKLTKLAFVASK